MISQELIDTYLETITQVSGIPRDELLAMSHPDRQLLAGMIAGRMRTRLDLFEKSLEAEVVLKLNDDVEAYIRTRDGEAG